MKSEDFLINVPVIISQENYNQLSHQVVDLITKLFIGQVNFHSKISEDIFIVFESGLEVLPRVVFILNFFDRWKHEADFLTNLTFTLSRQKYDYTYLPILNVYLYLWSCLV